MIVALCAALLSAVMLNLANAQAANAQTANAQAGDARSPGAVVDSYQGLLKRYEHMSFKLTVKTYAQGGTAYQDEKPLDEQVFDIRRAGDRFYANGKSSTIALQEAVPQESGTLTEVVNDGQLIHVERQSVDGKDSEGSYEISAYLNPTAAISQTHLFSSLGRAMFISGRLECDPAISLIDIARSGMVEPADATSGDSGEYSVSAKSPHGQYSLTLNSKNQGLPTTVRVTKTGSHLIGGQRIDSLPPMKDDGTLWPDGAKLVEFMSEVKTLDVQQVSEVPVPSSFEVRSESRYDNGAVVSLRSLCTLTDIEFNDADAEASFSITSSIPNGTGVTVHDSPAIDYVWLEGAVEPDPGDEAIETATNAAKARYTPYYIAALLVVAVAGIALFNYRKKLQGG